MRRPGGGGFRTGTRFPVSSSPGTYSITVDGGGTNASGKERVVTSWDMLVR